MKPEKSRYMLTNVSHSLGILQVAFHNPSVLQKRVRLFVSAKIDPVACISNHLSHSRISVRTSSDNFLWVCNIYGITGTNLICVANKRTGGHGSPRSEYIKVIAIDLGMPTSSNSKYGSPVMTVRAEKSIHFPIRLPQRRPSLPFKRARIAFTGRPDFAAPEGYQQCCCPCT